MRRGLNRESVASIATLLAAALWGLYWIPIRYMAAQGLDVASILFFTNAPAAFLCGLVLMARWPSEKRFLTRALLIGGVAGLALALYGFSVVLTSVVRATLFFYLMPLWGTLIGMIWLREIVGWHRWLAMIFGLLGLWILTGGAEAIRLNQGDLFALLSGLMWAIAAALIKKRGEGTLAGMAFGQFFFAALGALFLGIGFGYFDIHAALSEPNAIMVGIGVSLIGLLPAVTAMFWASQYLFPGRVGVLLTAEIVVAVISASLILPQEALRNVEYIAVALIIGAALLEVITIKRRS